MDPFGAQNFETHIVEDTFSGESCAAFFDSATTYTILKDKSFFYENNLSTWQIINLMTMARTNVFHF